jgi:uncharacterized membrane protein (UPF0136 family)
MPPHYLAWLGAGIACLGYAAVACTGGVMGYVRKGSKPSLIAGSASGLLLLVCAIGLWMQPWYATLAMYAAIGAIVISLLLVGRFVGTLMKERRVYGGFTNTPMGRIAVTMVGLGLITAILNVIVLSV